MACSEVAAAAPRHRPGDPCRYRGEGTEKGHRGGHGPVMGSQGSLSRVRPCRSVWGP